MKQLSTLPNRLAGCFIESAWQRPEIPLLGSAVIASFAISGAAIAVLLSPNLGQQLVYVPLIDEATLEANRRTSIGEQLLGQVARVLEIDIVKTQGPSVGARNRSTPAMTIVAHADEPAIMPDADLAVGLKTMLLAAGVGLVASGLIRRLPSLPIGPQRRQPLSQRVTPASLEQLSLAQPLMSQPIASSQTLIPGALSALPLVKLADDEQLQAQVSSQESEMPSTGRSRKRRPVSPEISQSSPANRLFQRLVRRRSRLEPPKLVQTASGPHGSSSQALEPRHVGEVVGRTAQRSRTAQPSSFVILHSEMSAAKQEQPADSKAQSSSLLSKSSTNAASDSPALLDLEALDVRRQYPLAALG